MDLVSGGRAEFSVLTAAEAGLLCLVQQQTFVQSRAL